VEENKASSADQPVPMFLEQTEARPDEMNKMVFYSSLNISSPIRKMS
jgi:hypothetical protein